MALGEAALYWLNWDGTGLNWDHPMTTGTVLGTLYWENWDRSGRSGMALGVLGPYWLNWDGSG